jgi:pyridoxal phosphate enzyme (YggS family)
MNSISDNIQRCREKMAVSAEKTGRRLEDITLVAVSKTVPPARINEAIGAGIRIIGENKVQEAQQKFDEVDEVNWHMVGHLQTNKVKYALKIFDLIQSVDTYHLAEEINKRAEKDGKRVPVLIEVNTSGEESKYGCNPDETEDLVLRISQLPSVEIKGLMTIGLFSDNPALVRPCFVKLRRIFDSLSGQNIPNVKMEIISMGMSADFDLAIEEGSNMVRIGTAIFGPRRYEN